MPVTICYNYQLYEISELVVYQGFTTPVELRLQQQSSIHVVVNMVSGKEQYQLIATSGYLRSHVQLLRIGSDGLSNCTLEAVLVVMVYSTAMRSTGWKVPQVS